MSIDIKQISTNDPLYQQERALRNETLLRPIGIKDFGWEHRDKEAHHIIAYQKTANKKDQVVGCVLLYQLPNTQTGQLMQMAVKSNLQKTGVGKSLTRKLLELAAENNLDTVFCHARESVYGFYEKLGFKKEGPEFNEVGVIHNKMIIKVVK